jgi:phosphoribosylaminoimidazole carboxylase
MLAQSASLLSLPLSILDVDPSAQLPAPAKQVLHPSLSLHLDGSFTDPERILELAKKVDVLTVEIEHVDVDALERAQKETGVSVQPAPSTLRTIQDKYLQKVHLIEHGIPVAESVGVESSQQAIQAACQKLGTPLMLKSRTGAYDGRGNFVLQSSSDASAALSALKGRPLYAERWAPFTKEVAVMVVRSISGEVISYPAVETVHKENVCHLVFAPLRSDDPEVPKRAREVAERAVGTFEGAGVFGVEMFLMPDGAPSPLLPTFQVS